MCYLVNYLEILRFVHSLRFAHLPGFALGGIQNSMMVGPKELQRRRLERGSSQRVAEEEEEVLKGWVALVMDFAELDGEVVLEGVGLGRDLIRLYFLF